MLRSPHSLTTGLAAQSDPVETPASLCPEYIVKEELTPAQWMRRVFV